MSIAINIKKEFTYEMISDHLLCTALESSSYASFGVSKDDSRKPSNIDDIPNNEYFHLSWCFGDGELCLVDRYEGDKYKINEESITKGLKVFQEKCPRHYADFLNENSDFYTGDCFLQCVVFGDVIYG